MMMFSSFFSSGPISTVHAAGLGTTYYVSSTGNDSNNGLSDANAWKTINKVNTITFNPWDKILFKGGNTFIGTIIVKSSGTASNPITYGSYGTGKAIISGLTPVNNWTNLGNNIWESVGPVTSLDTIEVALIDGIQTPMGRFPNNWFFTYKSHDEKISITDNEGLSWGINWAGAELAMFTTTYTIDRNTITSQSNGTLYYSRPPDATGEPVQRDGLRYIIQNDVRTLDSQNEWYFDKATKKLKIYSSQEPTNVQVSSIESVALDLISVPIVEYVIYDGLSFRGSNANAITLKNIKQVTIINSEFKYIGNNAIEGTYWAWAKYGLNISHNTFSDINTNAIFLEDEYQGAYIWYNTISNVGTIMGLGASWNGANIAIRTLWAWNNIESNTIFNIWYIGIEFHNNNVNVNNNYISNVLTLKTDGSAIYTWNGVGTIRPVYYNRKVFNNIILNSPTALWIYMDDGSQGVEIYNNIISGTDWGIYLHGNQNINVHDNTVFNSLKYQLLVVDEFVNDEKFENISINNNIFISKLADQKLLVLENKWNNLASIGSIDNNYYIKPTGDTDSFEVMIGREGNIYHSLHNLEGWKQFSNYDLNSTSTPVEINPYELNSLIWANMAENSEFTNNINGLYISSENGNLISSRDNTSKINGIGSLKLVPSISTNSHFSIYNESLGTPISSTKKYIVRFTTIGSSENIPVKVALRQTNNPWATLTEEKTSIFGTTKKTHELLFDAPISDSWATFLIDIPENVGTVYIDDIVFSEVNATSMNTEDFYRFEYNATSTPKIISLSGNIYMDAKKNTYSGSISLDPWTSLVLMKTSGASEPPANIPPTVSAGSGQTIKLPTNSVTLNGFWSDSDGTIVSYLWTKVSGNWGTIVSPNSTTTLVSWLTAWSYIYRLTVTDNKGVTSSDEVWVIVNAAGNTPPVVSAWSDQTITLPTSSATLNGSKTDSDGTIVSYLRTKISGSGGTIVSPNNKTTTISWLTAWNYTYRLTVTDNNGAISSDDIWIIVNTAISIPVSSGWGGGYTTTTPTTSTPLKSDTPPTIKPIIPPITKDKFTGSVTSSVYNYTQEEMNAYKFAQSKWYTTTISIEQEKVYLPLTRGELAIIMGSHYSGDYSNNIINTKECEFNDISSSNLTWLKKSVDLLCNQMIMGKNMGNEFQPNTAVTRAESATVISRFFARADDGESKYYSPHIEQLNNRGYIKETDPNLIESKSSLFIILHRIFNSIVK